MSDNNKPSEGNPSDESKKPKKNPPPVAKPLKKKRKKGPATAVKIPQGMTTKTILGDTSDHCFSLPNFQM